MKRLRLPKIFVRWLNKLSMRSKMVISFSVPILMLCLFLAVPVSNMVIRSGQESTLRSSSQSFEQAQSFLDYFLHTMDYASDQIYYNGDLQSILNSPDFHGDRNIAVQYREYLKLDKVFISAERQDVIYQAKIYIPDDINYINNQHFSRQSDLESEANYEDMLNQLQNNKQYFTGLHTVHIPGKATPAEVVSLRRFIHSTDGADRPLAVMEISVQETKIRDVLKNANPAQDGCVYLLERDGTVLSTSNAEPVANFTPPNQLYDTWQRMQLNGENYYIRSAYLTNGSWLLVSLVSEHAVSLSGQMLRQSILYVTILAMVACFTLACYLSGYYTRNLKLLQKRMESVQQGHFDVSFSTNRLNSEDEIGCLFKSFEYMTRELERLMKEQYHAGQALQKAELRALRAQINPHILYNTLDLINWEALECGAPSIAELTYSLANFYRISLNKGRHIVTIAEELLHVETYVALENLHFDNAIELVEMVPEEIRGCACINIILQPFVENSINHGFVNQPSKQSCHIVIRAEQKDKDIYLYVEDDGVGMTQAEMEAIFTRAKEHPSHGYGITNINSRLKLYYGSEYGVKFDKADNGGMQVCIHIPAMTMEEAEARYAHLSDRT